jgi:cysteinyl-tRNA synthetase
MDLAFWLMRKVLLLWQPHYCASVVRLLRMKLYDSRSAELKDFAPIRPGEVSIYVCGPTVQSAPHIGHLRSALAYDLLAKWLTYRGFKVTLVRNVTDIDDKVLEKALEQKTSWWSLAYANEQVFAEDYKKLGVALPSYEPRATGHVPQMVELIQLLIDRGHAYQSTDGSANVYFDTASWPSYGELTNQGLDDMESEPAASGKKRPQDFALWKAHKSGEPESASWNTPFGKGRPGWHIECSAMATHYLGESFDIHGGGLDLRFPHHENELAQSTAAGHKFANLWLHNGLVTTAGQKMSKSLGNSVSSDDLFKLASPPAVRYYLLSAHYRSVLDYQPAVLAEAQAALDRVLTFVERAQRTLSKTQYSDSSEPKIPEEFASEMDQDLNIPAALAVLHDKVRSGNADLDSLRYLEASQRLAETLAMLDVLGLSPENASESAAKEHDALDSLIRALIEERNQARANKDYARADELRDRLIASGIELSDSSDNTHWKVN